MMDIDDLKQILSAFKVDLVDVSIKEINQGYINNTFLILKGNTPTFILQQINHSTFKDIKGLQQNVVNALSKLHDSTYAKINLIETHQNASFLEINDGYWRLMSFIANSVTHNTTQNPKIAYEAGRIIGKFHQLLQEEHIDDYIETIANFHSLNAKKQEFLEAIKSANPELKEGVQSEIEFAFKQLMKFEALDQLDLPLRICHNDTKLNNILFNKKDEALCLIDLDTIMKGHFHYDFGDAIRTIVNTAQEDETDFTKITFNLGLFQSFVKGLSSLPNFLSTAEKNMLPLATALMPFIHGLRALTDYLNGNVYYKITYPDQNLDRSKNLFYFTKLALEREAQLRAIVVKTFD